MSGLFPTYAKWNIEPKHAEGSWLTSREGIKYLDYTSGIGVLNMGHRHELIMKAVKNQLDRFWHTSNLFQNTAQEETAVMLAEAAGLGRVFFANSGAEANEAAIKLARKASGKTKIITCTQSFHGRTFGTMAATGQDKIRKGFGPVLDGFIHIPFNDAAALEETADAETAAIMFEVVQGEGGIHVMDPAYAETLKQTAAKYGILLIVDEIQTGIGRTGKPFAYQHFNLNPDIVTAAKGLGNGLPIGAMIGKEELAEYFGPGSHGSTFGGNPVSTAAAKAVLTEVMREEFLASVREKGHYLFENLKEKLKESEFVVEIRGMGMMIGIEIKEESAPFLEKLQQNGLLVLTAGPKVIRILPPLTTSYEEMNHAVGRLAEVLQAAQTV